MTKQEIINRIDRLATLRMYLACKDRWTRADFEEDDKMVKEQNELEAMLKEME